MMPCNGFTVSVVRKKNKIVKTYLSLLVLAAFIFSSCKKNMDESRFEISLNACNSTNLEGNVEICYLELLEDSRCPANANCFDQGVAKARFTIKVDERQESFELSTLDRNPNHKNKIEALGYTIRLIQILPYPGLSGTVHSAEIEITK
jgi:hypothetical protein